MLPSSVKEGKLWPKAMAGVVRAARVPTTPRSACASAAPSLSKEGSFLARIYVARFRGPEFSGMSRPYARACLQ